jgi:hypothetical protein
MRRLPPSRLIGAAFSEPRRPSKLVANGVTGADHVRPKSYERRSSIVRSSLSLPLPML